MKLYEKTTHSHLNTSSLYIFTSIKNIFYQFINLCNWKSMGINYNNISGANLGVTLLLRRITLHPHTLRKIFYGLSGIELKKQSGRENSFEGWFSLHSAIPYNNTLFYWYNYTYFKHIFCQWERWYGTVLKILSNFFILA